MINTFKMILFIMPSFYWELNLHWGSGKCSHLYDNPTTHVGFEKECKQIVDVICLVGAENICFLRWKI